MNHLALCAVLSVGLSLGAVVVAHAAPSEAPTAVKPGVVRLPVAASIFRVDAVAIPVANKCGEPIWARVKLTNKTNQPWSGVVNLSAGTMKSEGVSLAKEGPDATKTVDVALLNKVECDKPLLPHMVRVWKAGDAGNTLYGAILKATTITAERPFTAATDTRPWLRRAVLNARCGAGVSPVVHLQASGSQPQPATVKLTFGTAVKEQTVNVLNTTVVPLEVSGVLDCNAANGIPSFEYALLTGNATSGKLDPVEVMFEP